MRSRSSAVYLPAVVDVRLQLPRSADRTTAKSVKGSNVNGKIRRLVRSRPIKSVRLGGALLLALLLTGAVMILQSVPA
jgi:hypothetical protein